MKHSEHYAECCPCWLSQLSHYAEYLNAECRYAECRGAHTRSTGRSSTRFRGNLKGACFPPEQRS